MLFYDERFQNNNRYVLLDTDKKISELKDFILDCRDTYTTFIVRPPIRYHVMGIIGNKWHPMLDYLQPYWSIDYSKDLIINFTFYQPQIIDDGGSNYHLVLLHKEYGSSSYWKMLLYKTDNELIPLIADKCKELYDFDTINFDRQTMKLFDKDGNYIKVVETRLMPIKI